MHAETQNNPISEVAFQPITLKNRLRKIPAVIISPSKPRLIAIVGATSSAQPLADEISKVRVAEKHGVSIIADVSTTDDIPEIQKRILEETSLPFTTVPLYEIYRKAKKSISWNKTLSRDLVLDAIEAQAERGVDCMTVHASHCNDLLPLVKASSRRIKIQGRGGGMIHEFMLSTGRENPLFEWFDDILHILARYDVALSLGNCLRSGTVDDPIDELVKAEIATWSKLTTRARAHGVKVMVEGGSHLRMSDIAPYVRSVSKKCFGAPLRMLGPLATERGLGYDHISGAISAVEAIRSGVALLTVITRAEHIGLPNEDELREAIVAYRIAIELATQPAESKKPDTTFTCGLGFEGLSADDFFDLEKAIELKSQKNEGDLNACSICNEMCRMKISPVRIAGDRQRIQDSHSDVIPNTP